MKSYYFSGVFAIAAMVSGALSPSANAITVGIAVNDTVNVPTTSMPFFIPNFGTYQIDYVNGGSSDNEYRSPWRIRPGLACPTRLCVTARRGTI